MSGNAEDEGLAVERFRSYLLLLAQARLRGMPAARINASDLVQQTLLDAHRQREQFRGEGSAEMAAWLRRMLACNLADALRALHRGKRDVNRERSLEAELAESSARLASRLAADQSSPSQRAMQNEQELRGPTPWPPCPMLSARPSYCITGRAAHWPRLPNSSAAAPPPWPGCCIAD
jgi:RNA polymerase sigma-70 factor (subfamily 1)